MTVMGKFHNSGNKAGSKNNKHKFQTKVKKEYKSTGKRGRLIVRNIPFKCNENELHKHFENIGKIKDIQLLRRPDKKLVGCGFVEFSSRSDADKAVEKLNGQLFMGRPIYVEKAVAQGRYMPQNDASEEESDDQIQNHKVMATTTTKIKNEITVDKNESFLHSSDIKEEEQSSDDEETGNSNHQIKEEEENKDKLSKNIKKARLIVRNLSFKSTEDKLKGHFSRFGELVEVKLLRRPNNTLVGCGFVQFSKKSAAAKAIHHTSGKPFLGRPIIVDWALAKDNFKKIQEEAVNKEIKIEHEDDEEITDVSNLSIKKEETSGSDSEESEKTDSDQEDETSDSEDDDEEHNKDGIRQKIKQEVDTPGKQRREDVEEGKTVFIKNLPFSVDNEEFGECMEQFGPIFYAVVCKDKLTEHSKGSGFVKFKNKDDAEKCLSAGTELTLKGNILDPHPALKRNEVQKLNDKKKEKMDNRNLYLVKEGLIIAGTPAARGVSVADMERRLQLEQWKTTKLRNLNMFVSRNRLVVHNVPSTMSDKQLRRLFQNTEPQANITEARIMRNLKKVDNKGQGLSKGYGFITFEKHEDALKALRSINNNPSVFTPTSRPIVAFSIENRVVLNSKTKRMIKSRQKNPLCKDYSQEETKVPAKKFKREKTVKIENSNEPEYAGITAKPGETVKMRQKYKLKNQAQQHLQDVRKQKREIKVTRQIRRAEHLKKKQGEKKVTKKRKNTVDNDAAFTNLVDKYKSKILSQANEKKKWYDE